METRCTHFHTVNVTEPCGVVQRCEICGKGAGRAGHWIHPPLEGWVRTGKQQTATAAMQQIPRQFRSPEDAAKFYHDQRCEFIQRIDPFVKVMVEIRMMQPMRYFIAEGRHIEPEILWMPGSKETYDLCQQMIDHIREQYLPGGG